jgi:MFS family permease
MPNPENPAPVKVDPYAAVRSANYRLFASGFLCSSTGLQMLSAAVLWDVYVRTEDALAIGIVGLCRALPVVALALPAGHVVDTFRRERVLMLTQVAMAGAAGLLAWSSYVQAPLWVIYALLVVTGCARSFNGPTRSSLLPQLVETGTFANAVTWNSGIFQFSAITGPIIAGVLMAKWGVAWPVYLLSSLLCLVLAINAWSLTPRPQERKADGPMTLASMTAGLSHVLREKTVLATITLDLFAVLLGGATALLPIYAKDILHVGPFGYGVLKASPYVGAFLMAVAMAHLPPLRRAGWALLISVAIYGLTIIGFGLSNIAWVSAVLLAIGGAADNVSVVIRHVLVQSRTPEHLRGRVSAVNSVFIECSNELGAFESGLVARYFGPVFSCVSGGIGTVLVVAAVAFAWPEIRRLNRLEEPK